MKINKLEAVNFRSFSEVSINFHDKLTVLIGNNGSGKTTILDGIALGFGRLYSILPDVEGISSKEADLRISSRENREPLMLVGWKCTTSDNQHIKWTSGRRRDASVASKRAIQQLPQTAEEIFSWGTKEIRDFAIKIIEDVNDQAPSPLPVIVYYGTNRAIRSEIQRRRGFRKDFSRFHALQGALNPDCHFRAAFEWFNAMEEVERREKVAHRDFDYTLPLLDAVRLAVTRVLGPSFSNPRTEARPLRFVIDRTLRKQTKTLRITQLSDGYRVVLGVVMDLARRLAEANTGVFKSAKNEAEKILECPAIVLIDEVDLHLHPEWQQRIILDLQRTFKGAQLIVSTHSPQVLSTVPPECLRKIEADEEQGMTVREDFEFLRGAESQYVLEEVLDVPARPNVVEAVKLRKYLELIREDRWDEDEALELRKELDDWSQGHEAELAKADIDIRMRAFRRNKNEKS